MYLFHYIDLPSFFLYKLNFFILSLLLMCPKNFICLLMIAFMSGMVQHLMTRCYNTPASSRDEVSFFSNSAWTKQLTTHLSVTPHMWETSHKLTSLSNSNFCCSASASSFLVCILVRSAADIFFSVSTLFSCSRWRYCCLWRIMLFCRDTSCLTSANFYIVKPVKQKLVV